MDNILAKSLVTRTFLYFQKDIPNLNFLSSYWIIKKQIKIKHKIGSTPELLMGRSYHNYNFIFLKNTTIIYVPYLKILIFFTILLWITNFQDLNCGNQLFEEIIPTISGSISGSHQWNLFEHSRRRTQKQWSKKCRVRYVAF